MIALQGYLVTIHQSELRREAERHRVSYDDTLSPAVRLAGRLPGGRYPSEPASGRPGPDPRRVLARAAARLSRAAAGTARWLDPSIEDGSLRRRASGVAGR